MAASFWLLVFYVKLSHEEKNNNLTAEEDIYLWMFQKPLFHPLPFCSCFVYILIWRKKTLFTFFNGKFLIVVVTI